jgi:hypothetical protein
MRQRIPFKDLPNGAKFQMGESTCIKVSHTRYIFRCFCPKGREFWYTLKVNMFVEVFV